MQVLRSLRGLSGLVEEAIYWEIMVPHTGLDEKPCLLHYWLMMKAGTVQALLGLHSKQSTFSVSQNLKI